MTPLVRLITIPFNIPTHKPEIIEDSFYFSNRPLIIKKQERAAALLAKIYDANTTTEPGYLKIY